MKKFSSILYVCENSAERNASVARAVSLARNNRAVLTLMDVVPSIRAGAVVPRDELIKAMTTDRRSKLESLVEPHKGTVDIRIEMAQGRKFLEVIRSVLRNGHDLVIKPAENPEWIERVFGSDDMHLLRKCPCPVWLTRPEENTDYRCVVAAVDFDTNGLDPEEQALNRQILEFACSVSLSDGADLHLVHVWDAPEAGLVHLWADDPDVARINVLETHRSRHRKRMNRIVQELRKRIGAEAYDHLSPRLHLPMGSANRDIPALVRNLKADLVVMGTVARTGIPGFFIGNTAEAILDQLQCSVLAIKPAGFVSPVTE